MTLQRYAKVFMEKIIFGKNHKKVIKTIRINRNL